MIENMLSKVVNAELGKALANLQKCELQRRREEFEMSRRREEMSRRRICYCGDPRCQAGPFV